ncbi:MAG: T9SS type A sorting domain-containing protein, partial [Bacteroidota bacterium]
EGVRIISADFTGSGTPNLYLVSYDNFDGNPELTCISSADLLILPVELLSFSVASTGKHLRLSWTTATESNNSHFEVQRSLNGTNFTAIGTVAGAGSSTVENSYSFTDEQAVAGQTYFYRLAQVDFDGTRSYSKIKTGSISPLADSGVSVYPNPATSTLTVVLPAEGAGKRRVELVNAVGQTVLSLWQAPNATGNVELDVRNVAPGLFTVKVSDKHVTRGVPVVIRR